MAGNSIGGKRAAATNKERHGDDFYKRIGGKQHDAWVKNGKKPRGFAYMKLHGQGDRVKELGAAGGSISRRKKDERS